MFSAARIRIILFTLIGCPTPNFTDKCIEKDTKKQNKIREEHWLKRDLNGKIKVHVC